MRFYATFMVVVLFTFFSTPILLHAHDDRDESWVDADYDLFDRQRDGLDWQRFESNEDPGTTECPQCQANGSQSGNSQSSRNHRGNSRYPYRGANVRYQ